MISYIPRIERIDKWRSGSIKNGKRVCVIPVEEGKFVEAEVCGFSDGVLHFYTPRAGRLHLQTVKEDGMMWDDWADLDNTAVIEFPPTT
eukprot:76707-Amorphochlora_amoeboformis.AAC.1